MSPKKRRHTKEKCDSMEECDPRQECESREKIGLGRNMTPERMISLGRICLRHLASGKNVGFYGKDNYMAYGKKAGSSKKDNDDFREERRVFQEG